MASQRRRLANQRNARKSTGPRSAEGKEVVARNALRHGLVAKHALLPEEDAEEFDRLRAALLDQLGPQGPLETEYAEEVVAGLWRLRRARRIEVGILVWERNAEAAQHAQAEKGKIEATSLFNQYAEVAHKMNERDYKKATKELSEARAAQKETLPRLGRAFVRGDGLSALSRYETTIRRAIDRALHELERMQAARRADESSSDGDGPELLALPGAKSSAGPRDGNEGA